MEDTKQASSDSEIAAAVTVWGCCVQSVPLVTSQRAAHIRCTSFSVMMEASELIHSRHRRHVIFFSLFFFFLRHMGQLVGGVVKLTHLSGREVATQASRWALPWQPNHLRCVRPSVRPPAFTFSLSSACRSVKNKSINNNQFASQSSGAGGLRLTCSILGRCTSSLKWNHGVKTRTF